jgi:hypothetical protein
VERSLRVGVPDPLATGDKTSSLTWESLGGEGTLLGQEVGSGDTESRGWSQGPRGGVGTRLTFSARTSMWLLEVVTMMSSGEKSLTSTANS